MKISSLEKMLSLIKKKHGIGCSRGQLWCFSPLRRRINKRKLARDHYSTFIPTFINLWKFNNIIFIKKFKQQDAMFQESTRYLWENKKMINFFIFLSFCKLWTNSFKKSNVVRQKMEGCYEWGDLCWSSHGFLYALDLLNFIMK